ncbi:hypothetical protein FRB99_001875 [Tulasnella sp. 403]|nr:hypothetical protein FRB99_001875 [Tulasnella sp. 403]
MLACATPSSRPRPPAKARRQSTRAESPSPPECEKPPPPYADPDDMFSSSAPQTLGRRVVETITTTSTRTLTFVDTDSLPSPSELRPAVHDVLNGRSREELQEMLLAAHNIIRKHERDLTRASNETTYLREQNLVMKVQFEKLRDRLPPSPANPSDPRRSRSNSLESAGGSAFQSPPMSPRFHSYTTPSRNPNSKRASITSPEALAELADENAELVSKLDQLQAETSILDQAGKRKLRKLEKEIDGLKDELEHVQKRNSELEKEVEEQESSKVDEEELERRRLEREERARLLRRSAKSPKSVRALGNQRMMSKKFRKPLSPQLFLSPPTSSSQASPTVYEETSEALLRPPNPVLPKRRRIPAPDFSERSPDRDPSPSRSSAVSLFSGPSSLRHIPSFGDMAAYLAALGLASSDTGGRDLGNELKAEYTADWTINEAEISRQMFEAPGTDQEGCQRYPSMRSTTSSIHCPLEDQPVYGSAAVDALQDALDAHNKGRLLEEDEHILPVGCLRNSPVETFYGLSQAVGARPNRWKDLRIKRPLLAYDDSSFAVPASPEQQISQYRQKMLDQQEEPTPWETVVYSEHDESPSDDEGPDYSPSTRKTREGEANWDDDDDPSPTKRISALGRLNETMKTRRGATPYDEDDDEDEDEEFYEVSSEGPIESAEYVPGARYDPKALASKLRNSYLQTFVEIWVFLQFVMVFAVFIYCTVRRGPRAVLGQSKAVRK